VNIKKVFEALTWLKNNNPLYSKIILPNTHDKLFLGNLDNMEFEKPENDITVSFSNECELLNNLELHMQDIKDHVEVTLDECHEAMLTQKNEDDSYYEQYTISSVLYEKKSNCNCLISNVKNSEFTFG